MKPKFLILVASAVGCLVAIAMLSWFNQGDVTKVTPAELFFPNLIDQINEISQIKITTNQEEITLNHLEHGWIIEQQDSYFANYELVRKLIIGMSQIRKLERKTNNPQNFSKLGLAGTDATDSKTVRIQLFAKDENLLADLLVGTKRTSIADPRFDLLFVREPNDSQTWLTEAPFNIPAHSIEWRNYRIVNVPGREVWQVEIKRPNHRSIRVFRANDASVDFQLDNIPDGHRVRFQYLINDIGRLFERLNFEEVVPVDHWNASTQVILESFDGLIITASLGTGNFDHYAVFEAKVDHSVTDDIRAESARMNLIWQGWAYRLSDVRVKTANSKLEDLVERINN